MNRTGNGLLGSPFFLGGYHGGSTTGVGDAFGTALSGSLVDAMQPGGDSFYQDGSIDRSELLVNDRLPQWSQDDADRYEGLVSAFKNPGEVDRSQDVLLAANINKRSSINPDSIDSIRRPNGVYRVDISFGLPSSNSDASYADQRAQMQLQEDFRRFEISQMNAGVGSEFHAPNELAGGSGLRLESVLPAARDTLNQNMFVDDLRSGWESIKNAAKGWGVAAGYRSILDFPPSVTGSDEFRAAYDWNKTIGTAVGFLNATGLLGEDGIPGTLGAAGGVFRKLESIKATASEKLARTGNPVLAEVEYGTDIAYLVEASKPSANGRLVQTHQYENPGHHDPSSGSVPYNPTKSVLPGNHIALFERSAPFKGEDGVVLRWAKDDSGMIHRFEPSLENIYHWSGATNGVTSAGRPRPLVVPSNVWRFFNDQ